MANDIEGPLLEPEAQKGSHLLRRIWEEYKLIWRTAFPAMLYRLSMFGVYVITQSFIGHINEVELAAYALVQAIVIRFANGILVGMSSATQTLCAQAFGAKQYYMMGIYLQRSWIINMVTATVMLPCFVFATPIFKLLGQEDTIADAVGNISLWFIGVFYAAVFTLTTESFLQAQRKNMLIGLLSPITFVLHVLLSWIFVSKLSWGMFGAMSAMVVSRWVFNLFMMIYLFGGWCTNTWTGFSKEAFFDLIPIVKLSISSGIMVCVELWYTSVVVLLAGYTSNAAVNISAFYISLNISQWQLMICLGFMSATCVRVANNIGKGNPKAAKFAIKLTLTTSVSLGLLCCVLCLIFGREIPYLFTSDDEVAEVAANLSVPLAISMLLNSIQTVLSGVAIGTGSQAKVAVVNIISYYLVGIPIGCILAYVADYNITGIFMGMISGQIIQVIVLAYMTWRIDWAAEIDKSRGRLSRFSLDHSQESNQSTNDS